jgi:hypothetical protein
MLRGEFAKRIMLLDVDEKTKEELLKMVEEAGAEHPCLACSSNDDCDSFKWYLKWFSNKVNNDPF